MAPPSEFDLRAALREGEGDQPSISKVMIAGDARRRRRARIASAAVIVAVAGGLGATAAEFGGSGGSGGANSAELNRAAGGAAEPMPAGVNSLNDVACPATPPTYALSNQHSHGTYASTPQLLAGRVSSVVVCAYGPAVQAASSGQRSPARLELAGHQAKQIARSLKTAPTAAPSTSCSSAPTDQYALIPVDASGKTGQPITAQLSGSGCALITNGTAIRYDWQPPPAVASKLDELTPSEPPDSPAPASTTAILSPTPSPTS